MDPQLEANQKSETSLDSNLNHLPLGNGELLELVHDHQKFMGLVRRLISAAELKIEGNEASEGVNLLTEAERILEYGASCGKNIDRGLIISVLHNEAYGYQRLWELHKCSNYLEAIIYNLNEKTVQLETPNVQGEPQNQSSSNTIDTRILSTISEAKMMRKMAPGDKIKLAKYHLQFSAVNSQLKNHQRAFDYTLKAVKIIHELFADTRLCFRNVNPNAQQATLVKRIGAGVLKLEENIGSCPPASYANICRVMHRQWLKKTSSSNQISDSLNSYSIGRVMQIKSYSKSVKEIENTKYYNSNYVIESIDLDRYELNDEKLTEQVLLLCVAYFTLATEARLAAKAMKAEGDDQDFELRMKEAESYHIISLIVFFAFVPGKIDFMNHLLSSYRNNFTHNLAAQLDEKEEHGTTQQELEMLQAFRSGQDNNRAGRSEKQEILIEEFNNISMAQSVRGVKEALFATSNIDRGQPGDAETTKYKIKRMAKKCQKLINERYCDVEPTPKSRNKSELKSPHRKSKSLMHHNLTTTCSKALKKKDSCCTTSKLYEGKDSNTYYDRILLDYEKSPQKKKAGNKSPTKSSSKSVHKSKKLLPKSIKAKLSPNRAPCKIEALESKKKAELGEGGKKKEVRAGASGRKKTLPTSPREAKVLKARQESCRSLLKKKKKQGEDYGL